MRARPLRLLLALALAPAGCAEELGPVRFETARVTGRVRVGATPLGSGFVELHPVGGTVGNIRSAPIRPDGSFEATGVAVGEQLLRVVDPPVPLPPPSADPRVRFDEFTSPLRRRIARHGAPLDIDLNLEAAVLRSKPRP
jgi:hypothetical protein